MCLVRCSGTNADLVELAKKNALAIGAGHSFILFLGEGFYPINVLRVIQDVPEVVGIFCATANAAEVVVADNGVGRGIMGIIEGSKPAGVETEQDVAWRKGLLRKIGYKL